MKKTLLVCALSCLIANGIALADSESHHLPKATPTVDPNATPTATPTPVPTCAAPDLASHQACVAACDSAASAVCSSEGHSAEYLAFLSSAISACSYPGIDNKSEYNALKDIIQGLRGIGALNAADAQTLRKKIDECRKALKNSHGHHGHSGENHGKSHH